MERAAQPLEKQSAPRKQMLLLQQAQSCWLLSGSFSQTREGGKAAPQQSLGLSLQQGQDASPVKTFQSNFSPDL